MKRIGFIGLGIMGRPMAENLLRAGFELVVWNRTRSKAEPLLAAGATMAASPQHVAEQVEALCINVTDTPDVQAVLFGADGVAEGGREGLIVIDHSTISPSATRRFAERLAQRGVTLLDAPVSGGDHGARQGTLAVMVGGQAEAFERCRTVFEAVGASIVHCGPSGAGQATKACNQVLCAVNLAAVCEALALAKAEGLDLSTVIDVTGAGAGGSWQLGNLGPKIAAGDMAPGFMVDLINKDLSIVADAARETSMPLPVSQMVRELFKAAAAHGHGRDGSQALGRVFERLGGFDYLSRYNCTTHGRAADRDA